uniref:Putative ribonucleoside diphosphate reductase n=1 Tax=viral metagenome TaxID=1070528 RepID=A0A6M3K348_9ZZZZ
MPHILMGDHAKSGSITDIRSKDLGYEYPDDLNLRPGSPLHEFLKKEIMDRAQESRNEMEKRFDSWGEIDKSLTAYIKLSDAEKVIKNKDKTDQKPLSIVFPYSYSVLETVLTYLLMAFGQEPILRYEGVSPEDTIGAILLEKVIALQCNKSKVILNLHTMNRDGIAYGIGPVAPYWNERWGERTVKVPDDNVFGSGFRKEVQEMMLFEGNALMNIDPYLYLPDPNVPVDRIQDGAFVGWVDIDNYLGLLEEEYNSQDTFNVRYLEGLMSKYSIFAEKDSKRREFIGGHRLEHTDITKRVDKINMYINIIPKEWKLSTREYPQKWFFQLAADEVIIKAKPLGLDHNMYPIAVAAPEFDGYSVTPISRLEVLGGLQKVLNWMFNCYDSETEVLTDRGWVPFPNTIEDDKVATVDPETLELWFEKPKQWFEYDYDGYMVRFKSSRMDMCVTPNHDMFVKRRYERVGESDSWQFKPAALLRDTDYLTVGNLNWRGNRDSTPIKLWGNAPQRERGQKRRYENVEISSDLMAGFLGWFLSEGSISQSAKPGTYVVAIKQSKGENYKQLDSIFDAMPFHVTRNYDLKKHACSWQISSKQLYEWLKENCYEGGTTGEFKKVPEFVKKWDGFTLSLLFDCAMKGDGYWMPSHPNLGKYGSKSKRLIDDMQEIALKLGYFSHIYLGKTPAGEPFYALNISTSSTFPYITSRNCFKSVYKGKVYCAENSTHLLVTRRRGKVAVQGNSHVANVRKAINDMLVVDPYLINIEDLKTPEPGKLIRMRRPAWGKGVKDAVMQLGVTDITANNIKDSALILQWMQEIGGADKSALSGSVRTGGPERLTGQEFQGARSGALSRMERIARVVGLQSMQDIGYMFASHTQQLMSQDTYIKSAGRWQEDLMKEYGPNAKKLRVSPFDILIDYDVMVRDGSIPGGNFSQAWVKMFELLGKHPLLSQRVDVYRVFLHIARNMGAKNAHEFENVQAQIMPNDQVNQQVQQGNMIPMGGMGGV